MSRLRADKLVNRAATGAPQLTYGAEIPVGYGLTGAGGINITGVITATTFSGNITGTVTGSATGLTGTPSIAVGVITATSVLVGSAVTITGSGIVGGAATFTNLTINGTQTIINTTNLEVTDKTLGINSVTSPSDANADGAGLVIYASTNKTLSWDNTNSRMAFSTNVYAPVVYTGGLQGVGIYSGGAAITTGIITALNFIGAGNTFAVVGNRVDISIAGSSGGGGGSAGLTTEALTASNANVTLNLSKQDHKVTATGICTILPHLGTEGESHTIRIVNSGIATVGFGTAFLFPAGSLPVLPTASGAISIISFTVHRVGTTGIGTQLLAGASLNFS